MIFDQKLSKYWTIVVLYYFTYLSRVSAYRPLDNGSISATTNLSQLYFTFLEPNSFLKLSNFRPTTTKNDHFNFNATFKFRVKQELNGIRRDSRLMTINVADDDTIAKFCIIDQGILRFQSGETILLWEKTDYGSGSWHTVQIVIYPASEFALVDVDGELRTLSIGHLVDNFSPLWPSMVMVQFGFPADKENEQSFQGCLNNVIIFAKELNSSTIHSSKNVETKQLLSSMKSCQGDNFEGHSNNNNNEKLAIHDQNNVPIWHHVKLSPSNKKSIKKDSSRPTDMMFGDEPSSEGDLLPGLGNEPDDDDRMAGHKNLPPDDHHQHSGHLSHQNLPSDDHQHSEHLSHQTDDGGQFLPVSFIENTDEMTIEATTTNLPVDNTLDSCRKLCLYGKCEFTESGTVFCKCNPGFVGNGCQFSHFPTSCQELAMFNKIGQPESLSDGTYRIMLSNNNNESSTSLLDDYLSFVVCNFTEAADLFGKSIIRHDLPATTEVRNQSLPDLSVTIEYSLNQENMKELVDISAVCKQCMVYECTDAPLGFDEKLTRFRSISAPDDDFYTTGFLKNVDGPQCSAETPQGCKCDRQYQVSNDTEALPNRGFYDQGELRGKQAGIVKATFKQYEQKSTGRYGYWTLANLTCEGLRGWDDAIQFKKANLELPIQWTGKKLTFRFKTDQSDAILLEQQHSIDKDNFITLSVKDGSSIHLKLKLGSSPEFNLNLMSQKPLNDGQWHLVSLEYKLEQIRLTLGLNEKLFDFVHPYPKNDPNELQLFNFTAHFDRNLTFGGSFENFTGCLSYFMDGTRNINLTGLITDYKIKPSSIEVGCHSSCDQMQDACFSGGRCVDNYVDKTWHCLCRDSRVVTGNKCEHDINEYSDVSLYDQMRSYILVTNFTENPLTNDLLFSFKTDQSGGLLLFVHDQFYNFRQIHLWASNKVTLSTNYRRSIKQCTISSAERDFDTMEWVQVELSRKSDHVMLKVGDSVCTISEPQDYSLAYVDEWENMPEIKDIVRPPTVPSYLLNQLTPNNFPLVTMLFIGGVPKAGLTRTKRQADGSYTTGLPSLLGAFRGLKIGELPANLQNYVTESKKRLVYRSSDFGCERLKCQNNGKCTINWFETTHERPTPSCDCSQTSYLGEDCSEDDDDKDYNMDGQHFLDYSVPKWSNNPNHESVYDSFLFAFNALNKIEEHKLNITPEYVGYHDWAQNRGQLLANLTFHSNLEINVRLVRNRTHSCLRITLNDDVPQRIEFFGDFMDGYRHMVYIRFRPQQLLLRIDQQQAVEREVRTDFALTNLANLTVGGGIGQDETSFRGCIAGSGYVHVHDTYDTIFNRFAPYTTLEHTASIRQHAKCNNFKTGEDTFRLFVDRITEPPNRHLLYKIEPFEDVESTPPPKSSQNLSLIVGIILGLISLVLLITAIALCKLARSQTLQSNELTSRKPDPRVLYQRGSLILQLEKENLIDEDNGKKAPTSDPDADQNQLDEPDQNAPMEQAPLMTSSQEYAPIIHGKPPQNRMIVSSNGAPKRAAPVENVILRKHSSNSDKKVRIASCSEMFQEI